MNNLFLVKPFDVFLECEHVFSSQSVNTYLNIAAGHQPQQSTLASSGWFIGMLLAIIFLLGVCLVVCLVKRNRGGKYAVQVSSACVVVAVANIVAAVVT